MLKFHPFEKYLVHNKKGCPKSFSGQPLYFRLINSQTISFWKQINLLFQ